MVLFIRELMPSARKYNPDLVQYCRFEWLQIMQNLTALARCDIRPPNSDIVDAHEKCQYNVKCWRRLGEMLDLEDLGRCRLGRTVAGCAALYRRKRVLPPFKLRMVQGSLYGKCFNAQGVMRYFRLT